MQDVDKSRRDDRGSGGTFCPEEFPRYIQSFTADNHYFLSIEQLLSDSAGQAP